MAAPQLSSLHHSSSSPLEPSEQLLLAELAAAVAVEDLDQVQRLLEPLVAEIVGGGWSVAVNSDGRSWCDVNEQQVMVGARFDRGHPADTLAADLLISIVHELGHVLYNDDFLDYDTAVSFVAATSSSQTAEIASHLMWLDGIFADARHRELICRDHPRYAGIVGWDRHVDLKMMIGATNALLGNEPGLLSGPRQREAFALLPPSEQVGLLMTATLDVAVEQDEWLLAATPAARDCFAALAPYLLEARAGQGREYIENVAPCYAILIERGLLPEALTRHYYYVAGGKDGQAFVVLHETFTGLLPELGRDADSTALEGLSATEKAALKEEMKLINERLFGHLQADLGRASLSSSDSSPALEQG